MAANKKIKTPMAMDKTMADLKRQIGQPTSVQKKIMVLEYYNYFISKFGKKI